MEYTTLGRTGLQVSVAGLGCGGFSRLGLGTGKTEADAIAMWIASGVFKGRSKRRRKVIATAISATVAST